MPKIQLLTIKKAELQETSRLIRMQASNLAEISKIFQSLLTKLAKT